ncbi:MAG: SAM-dependent methyltransferase [Streptosporangiaceae bacterium]
MEAEQTDALMGFDRTLPNEARLIDYLMGGKDNFAADRAAAEEVLKIAPELPMMIREGRKFLGRAVRYLASEGVRQYIDIGCGLPTQGSVHQILQAVAPQSRVVYVDLDPVVIAHSNALIDTRGMNRVVRADVREPDALLDHPSIATFIDLRQPTAIVLKDVIASIPEDDIVTMISRRLVDRMAPGSYLLFSHAVSDVSPAVTEDLARVFQESQVIDGDRPDVRTTEEVRRFMDGLELLPPGLVPLPAWRPGPGEPSVDPTTFWGLGAIARKP